MTKAFLGELLGTFILVFIGCGTVGLDILFNAFSSLFLIALMWVLGVSLAIYSSRSLSGAHLNPAVSLWVFLKRGISKKRLLVDFLAQFTGAFLAAMLLFIILEPYLVSYENELSLNTAKMFGEYYTTPTIVAFIMEFLGTVFLLSGIQVIVNRVNNKKLHPLLIGLIVGVAIVIVAPYTQCGINPARDVAPRIFSYFAGWGKQVFSQSFFVVYVFSPLIASWTFFKLNK